MKKALIVATVAAFIANFERNNISLLQNMNYEVHVLCDMNACSNKEKLKKMLQLGVIPHDIKIRRNPFKKENIIAYREIKKIVKEEEFDLVHCHTPVGGVLGRIVARKYRKNGTKVIYTAHGFHFCKNAPKKNWLLFYPVEWLLAHWTDVLITINEEDYTLAQKHMHAGHVEYVQGVGIDLKKFVSRKLSQEQRDKLRESIGVGKEDKLLLSVGELNRNKNHEVVLRAIAKLEDKTIHYAIAGRGGLHDYLSDLANSLGVGDRVHLLGFRNDVADLYKAADICVFPSIREGLGLAAIEGMASGLPLICADNRGTREYAEDGQNAFVCKHNDVKQFANAIEMMTSDSNMRNRMGIINCEKAKRYDVNRVIAHMKKIYEKVL